MEDLVFETTEGEPKPEDFKVITDGLLAYHASHGHPREKEKYSIFLKDDKGKIYGGIIVTFSFNLMHIDQLWIDEMLRGKHYGTQLMEMVEKEAIKRGCTISCTDTFSYQAPKFYENLGYAIYGKLEDFPEGSSLIYYYKKLK